MATVSFSLPEKAWAGLNTRFRQESNYIDSDQFTAGSFNFLTDFTGAIVKVPGGTQYSTLSNINADQYEAVFTSGVRHLLEVENGTLKYTSGDGTFHTVTAGYNSNANFEFTLYDNRVYFDNGVDNPQSYDLATSYGGVTYTAPKTKDQGAQVPSSAPTFGADTSGGAVPAGAHTYKVTFLYYDFEESNGGPTSSLHTVSNPNNTVNLTALPIGGYGVTARKIYRDDNDGNYVLVGVVSNNTATTFADTQAIGTTPIPLDNGVPPIYSLVTTHLDRVWVAGVAGNTSTLYFSEAGLPDIFSVFGNIPCNATDPISGLVVYNDRVLVFNRHSMGQVLNRDAADFRYSEITPNVGCIDNRSIKIRTIHGLPTIMWLSEFGWYEFNGSSVNAISTEIDDQVQFNLQQGSATKGQHTDTNQTDFQAGTASPGIDLLVSPGNITTKTPVREWQTEADWEGGSSLTNVVTHSGLNDMEVPLTFQPTLTDPNAVLTPNAIISGGNLTLSSSSGFTGTTPGTPSFIATPSPNDHESLLQEYIPPISGNLTSLTFTLAKDAGSLQIKIWSDSFGVPASVLAVGGTFPSTGSSSAVTRTWTGSVPMVGGTRYWVGVGIIGFSGALINHITKDTAPASPVSGPTIWSDDLENSWHSFPFKLAVTSTFSVTPISDSGSWTSPVVDSESDSISTGLNITLTASFPSPSSFTVLLQGTNDDPTTMVPTWTTTDSQSNFTGNLAFAGSGFRWWRILIQLSTSDNRFVPVVSAPQLFFNTTSTWISEVIDHTTDVVSLDQLVLTATVPASTSATITIATSTDNITYSSYTALGSAVVHRYSKIKVVMTANAGDSVTPFVTDVLFTWTLTSNLISAPIDTGAIPAGWDIFQDSSTPNDGTITFYMRSATSSGALGAATFFAVTNGAFPPVPVHQFAQWKVVLTNHDANLATVASITINWFVTLTKSIRAASLFFKKRYYMAAAEFNQTTNNVVYVYDEFNSWKIIRGVTISTLGLFFNEPYYGDSSVGRIIKWLVGNTNVGTANIAMDVRTKSFSKLPSQDVGVGADDVTIRWIRSLVLKAVGTGATITPTYSVDGGVSFLPMQLIETGNQYVVTPNDGVLHAFRFTPIAEDVSSTRSIMLRFTNNDAFPVSVTNMKVACMTSRREVFNG